MPNRPALATAPSTANPYAPTIPPQAAATGTAAGPVAAKVFDHPATAHVPQRSVASRAGGSSPASPRNLMRLVMNGIGLTATEPGRADAPGLPTLGDAPSRVIAARQPVPVMPAALPVVTEVHVTTIDRVVDTAAADADLARVGLRDSPEAQRIWKQASLRQVEAGMDGKWGTESAAPEEVLSRIFRADGLLDTEALHAEMQRTSPDDLMAALLAASWCDQLAAPAMLAVAHCLQLREADRWNGADVEIPLEGGIPRGEDAQRVLVSLLSFTRAYLPYLAHDHATSLRRGHLPLVQAVDFGASQSNRLMGVARFDEGAPRPVLSFDSRRIADTTGSFEDHLDAKVNGRLVRAFARSFEGTLLSDIFHLHGTDGSAQRRAALDAGVFVAKLNAIPNDLEMARLRGVPVLAGSLLEKTFIATVHQQRYGINQMLDALLKAIRAAGIAPEADALPVLLDAYFQDDKDAAAAVVAAMSQLAQDPRFRHYAWLPRHDLDSTMDPPLLSARQMLGATFAVGTVLGLAIKYVCERTAAPAGRAPVIG